MLNSFDRRKLRVFSCFYLLACLVLPLFAFSLIYLVLGFALAHLLAVVLYDIGLSKWRKKVVDSNQIKKKKGLELFHVQSLK